MSLEGMSKTTRYVLIVGAVALAILMATVSVFFIVNGLYLPSIPTVALMFGMAYFAYRDVKLL